MNPFGKDDDSSPPIRPPDVLFVHSPKKMQIINANFTCGSNVSAICSLQIELRYHNPTPGIAETQGQRSSTDDGNGMPEGNSTRWVKKECTSPASSSSSDEENDVDVDEDVSDCVDDVPNANESDSSDKCLTKEDKKPVKRNFTAKNKARDDGFRAKTMVLEEEEAEEEKDKTGVKVKVEGGISKSPPNNDQFCPMSPRVVISPLDMSKIREATTAAPKRVVKKRRGRPAKSKKKLSRPKKKSN